MTAPRLELPAEPVPVRDPTVPVSPAKASSTPARTATLDSEDSPHRRRAPWRQRLVDLERGFTLGLRTDGALFVLWFGAAMTVLAGLVLGLSLAHWIAVVLALTGVLVAGMFNQVLKAVWLDVGRHFQETAEAALRMGIAAVYVATLGSAVTIVLVFADHCRQLFGG